MHAALTPILLHLHVYSSTQPIYLYPPIIPSNSGAMQGFPPRLKEYTEYPLS